MVFQTQKYSSLTSLVYITDYYPFGKELRFYKGEPNEKFLSTQHERDRASNYDHRQARNSTSEFGVFLSVDPLADQFASWIPYHYVHNNPIRLIDPTGESAEDCCGGNDRPFGEPDYLQNEQKPIEVPDTPKIGIPFRVGSLGLGVNFEIVILGLLTYSGSPQGTGILFDLVADAENNLDILKTTKKPDESLIDQFGFTLDLQFSFTIGRVDNPNPLNNQMVGEGREFGAGSGPFGYSKTSDTGGKYNQHTIPILGLGIDFGVTRWKVKTEKIN
ncbi:MAG: RHS repeat domain-containing protein [Luteibaculaceae bacterium]